MPRRAFLLVMDSVGIGGAPDAAAFGDAGADTLGHIAAACAEGRVEVGRSGPLHLPYLEAMGIGAAARAAVGALPPGLGEGSGIWAAAREVGRGKDTPSGHWELAGAPVDFDWGQFPEGDPCFPVPLIEALIAEGGLPGVLGQVRSNGVAIIEEHGAEHLVTGAPILYGSADSVLQIAAHEEAFGLSRLYDLCAIARRLCDPLRIGRVIARPFTGTADAGFTRTPNRRDFSAPPHMSTLCDRVLAAGGRVTAVGKIGDIFAHRGISETLKGPDDMALFDQMLGAMKRAGAGELIFANFVEFDSNYGHMRDVAGYARALERFDRRMPDALACLRPGDLMIITADHGNDPTWHGSDHTREQVPVLIAAPGEGPRALGSCAFADVGATIASWLGLDAGEHGRPLL